MAPLTEHTCGPHPAASCLCRPQDYVGISLEVGDSEVADLMMGVCMFVQEMVQVSDKPGPYTLLPTRLTG